MKTLKHTVLLLFVAGAVCGCSHPRPWERPPMGFSGEWRTYYDNGQRCSRAYYENGRNHGIWREWYKSGRKRQDGAYVNGQRDGVWQTWDMKGRRVDLTIYLHDVPLPDPDNPKKKLKVVEEH